MLWETWQHGPGPLPQDCPAPQSQQPFSFTIATVAVPGGAGWYVNQDHSKWGVTSERVPSCCNHQVKHLLTMQHMLCIVVINLSVLLPFCMLFRLGAS